MAAIGTPAVVLEAFSQLIFYAIFETDFSPFLGPFGSYKWRQNRSNKYDKSALFLGVFLDGLCSTFGGIFGTRSGPRIAKRCSREPSRAPRRENVEGSKQANGGHFLAFWMFETTFRGSRCCPKGSTRPPRLRTKTRPRKNTAF